MNRLRIVCCALLFAYAASASRSFCFRVYLKDKGETRFSILSPEEFLSAEAVERRMVREVFVDESDFPISQSYLDAFMQLGAEVVTQSKWMKTVVVESPDSSVVESLKTLSFVDSVKCVWNGENRRDTRPCADDTSRFALESRLADSLYGHAAKQIELLNGVRLHEAGYRGKDMRIAVIDAGFMNADRIEAFEKMEVIGVRNVVFPERDVFCEDEHGTKVLSCLAANAPGVMVGTAPDASYLLVKSEDTRGESPVEEDFWAAAVEYADSVGVDVISSSLGYFKYESAENSYVRENLDGKTAFISRVAEMASQKGALVFCSAGNEGSSQWGKITFPADAANIMTVGSVSPDNEKSGFSSTGMTADYRIKPDVVALGSGVCVIGSSGNAQYVNGTSFSAPTLAGLAACLWQAFPLLKNTDVMDLIKQSAGQKDRPDAQVGYGVPDMFKAYNKANSDDLQKP